MAFDTKEQEIIKYGIEHGKSKDEVISAIAKLRSGITPIKTVPVEQKPNYLQRVGQDIKQGVKQSISDLSTPDNRSDFSKGVSAISNISSAIVSPITEAPGIKQIGDLISKGVSMGGEELSKLYTPEFKAKLASLSPEEFDKVTQPLKDATNLGNIANTILAVKGGVRGAEKISNTVQNIKPTFDNLVSSVKENAVNYPKEIVNKLTDTITPIDKQTKNILGTTSIEKFNNYVKYGEEAIKNPRAMTPLEKAGDVITQKVLPTIKDDLTNIGKQMEKSIGSISKNQVPNAISDAMGVLKEGIKRYKLTDAESKLVKDAISKLEIGKNPTVESLSKTVDQLQNSLFESRGNLAMKVTPRVQGIINQTIGKLNSTLKTYIEKNLKSPEYTQLNKEYMQRKFLFDKLNKALGSEGVKGGSLIKRFFSPQDSGVKQLFADIKEKYGVDLAEDATLAKFVMDSLNDVRSKSLLEQIPLSKGGVITKGLQTIEKKLTKPISKARRIIEKRPQEGL